MQTSQKRDPAADSHHHLDVLHLKRHVLKHFYCPKEETLNFVIKALSRRGSKGCLPTSRDTEMSDLAAVGIASSLVS
jgi:hypothetical protein